VYYFVAGFIGLFLWGGIFLGGFLLATRFPDRRPKVLALYSASIAAAVAVSWLFPWTRVLVAFPILAIPVGTVWGFWRSLVMLAIGAPLVWSLALAMARQRGAGYELRRAWNSTLLWALLTLLFGVVLFGVLYMPFEVENLTIKPRLIEDINDAETLAMGSAVVVSLVVVFLIYVRRDQGEIQPR
jgi:hypothetical protein